MSSATKPLYSVKRFPNDEMLVRECLHGNQQAWSDLIDKYKSLIFSIPIKYGLSPDDAAEIFQSMCFTLLQELPNLREPRVLAAWLIKSTARKCYRCKHQREIFTTNQVDQDLLPSAEEPPDEFVEELEREQMLRESIAEISGDCARLIQLLFFATPPLSYEAAAQALGLAKGSIGATRMRCLEKLRVSLEKKGFR